MSGSYHACSPHTHAYPALLLPVWSDIPDPYNLTVGDSFILDLNSYVTGSPTIRRNAGAIPAGLSFNGGLISGTVTTVETRNLQFTATNSAGSAESEWVSIVVAASAPTLVNCAVQAWTGCTVLVSSSTQHRVTCTGGHTYWTCNAFAVDWHTTSIACLRPGCNVSITKCQNDGSGGCFSNGTEFLYHQLQ